MISFILGGAQSGKSQYAETRVMQRDPPWIYLATGRAWDDEMVRKIRIHQARRGPGWKTVEEPLDPVSVLKGLKGQAVLIDCLTLWLTNLMMEKREIGTDTDCLVRGVQEYAGDVVMVSNEVGQGIVPDNPMARRFVHEAGLMHQKIAAVADEFVMMHAGFPLIIKSGKG